MSILIIIPSTLLAVFIIAIISTEILPVFGATKFKNKTRFENVLKTSLGNKNESSFAGLFEYIFLKKNKKPKHIIKNPKLNREIINNKTNIKNQTQITWFGHSSVLIQSKELNVLTDPVFNRASPYNFIGPKSFRYENKLNIDELPQLDYILISHDHYDHLDHKTVKKLNKKTKKFLVPRGVKAHLVKWGIEKFKIKELHWWEEEIIDKNNMFAYTPARHFSGRKLSDTFKTLWGSWVIKINNKKIYFSGDSGYCTEFKKIGNKYGPFDLTMIENGAYSKYWPQIHMQPEETLQAHIDLKGKQIMPIHWGKFDLSYHAWTEPIERLTKLVKNKKQKMITPHINETFYLEIDKKFNPWWEL
jgi:L-ascorbate metabolism protein UlaG (beta-lactamase superfamily)